MKNNENQDLYIRIKCAIISTAKRWQIILMCMLVCAVGADVLRTILYHPQYITSVTATVETENNVYSDLEGSRDYITTMDYILNGQVVKDYVAQKMNQESVDYRCEVFKDELTNIINLRILSSSQRESYLSLKYIVEWYTENTEKYQFEYSLNLIESPVIGEIPVEINHHGHNFVFGLILGGIVSVGIVGILEFMKKNIKCSDDIEKYINCRLYAKIPKEKKQKKKKGILITSLNTSFEYKEAIKKLRRKIEESSRHHKYKVYMLTSPLENEGKSSIAANLAIALAKNKHKVLLIDCDIRKPAIHKIFSVSNKDSINDYLKGKGEWEKGIHLLTRHNLVIATIKKDLKNAEKLFNKGRWNEFIDRARKEYDFIILDTSPAYFLNDALKMDEYADASLLVVRQNTTQINVINETIDRLQNVKQNVIGCIYNASVFNMGEKINHGYGDYHDYSMDYEMERRD